MKSSTENSLKVGGCAFINQLSTAQALKTFMQCNTSHKWCERMEQSRPFSDHQSLFETADEHWKLSTEADLTGSL